jgi:hypothetical protein
VALVLFFYLLAQFARPAGTRRDMAAARRAEAGA